MVTGGVTGDRRQEQFDAFNDSPDCRLFVGNIKAAGTGWSANACSNVAFAEFGWTPSDMIQCEDRCHGINRGQKGIPTTAYYLTAENTIDSTLVGVLHRKQKAVNAVLDGNADSDGSVFDEVIKGLLTGAQVIDDPAWTLSAADSDYGCCDGEGCYLNAVWEYWNAYDAMAEFYCEECAKEHPKWPSSGVE